MATVKICVRLVLDLLPDLFPLHSFNSSSVLTLQVTKGMFGARKKFVEFVEVVDNDFTDESMFYNQPSMFPHRSDKDVSFLLIAAHFLSFLELEPEEGFSSCLTLSSPQMFSIRCCPLLHHRHQVSCRSLVQVCMVHKVSVVVVSFFVLIFSQKFSHM